MARPQDLIEAVLSTLQNVSGIPNNTNFIGYEPDVDSEAIKLPLITVSVDEKENLRPYNSQLIGYKTDGSGNNVARRYEMEYNLVLDVQVWTAHGSKYSPRRIGNTIRTTLYDYTKHGPAQVLQHPNIGSLDEVWNVVIQDESHTDELARTPTLRRWSLSLALSASEIYVTEDSEPVRAFTESVELQ